MKRSQQSVPNAMTGAVSTDQGFASNPNSQSMMLPKGTARNTDVGRSGAGQVAPRPRGGANISGNDRPTAGVQASMARVPNAGGAPAAGNFLPVRKPPAGLANSRIGQQNPQTGAAATVKPKRKGIGAAFYGEYK
jgi:hypothetical protein